MLDISEQQLRGWQRQGFISASENFSFSDLIALRALQKLRENRIPSKQIGRALVSLKQKLSDVSSPLSELKIISHGRSITAPTKFASSPNATLRRYTIVVSVSDGSGVGSP